MKILISFLQVLLLSFVWAFPFILYFWNMTP